MNGSVHECVDALVFVSLTIYAKVEKTWERENCLPVKMAEQQLLRTRRNLK